MSTFGVGPAADGKNVGLDTNQNSRMLPGGKVVDSGGRTLFDPAVDNVKLVVHPTDEGVEIS